MVDNQEHLDYQDTQDKMGLLQVEKLRLWLMLCQFQPMLVAAVQVHLHCKCWCQRSWLGSWFGPGGLGGSSAPHSWHRRRWGYMNTESWGKQGGRCEFQMSSEKDFHPVFVWTGLWVITEISIPKYLSILLVYKIKPTAHDDVIFKIKSSCALEWICLSTKGRVHKNRRLE